MTARGFRKECEHIVLGERFFKLEHKCETCSGTTVCRFHVKVMSMPPVALVRPLSYSVSWTIRFPRSWSTAQKKRLVTFLCFLFSLLSRVSCFGSRASKRNRWLVFYEAIVDVCIASFCFTWTTGHVVRIAHRTASKKNKTPNWRALGKVGEKNSIVSITLGDVIGCYCAWLLTFRNQIVISNRPRVGCAFGRIARLFLWSCH